MIAEGPLEGTVRNMLKVVYDKKCGAIVMLSKLMENGMVSQCINKQDLLFIVA